MKRFKCIKDYYDKDILFAKAGDVVALLNDNTTIVNQVDNKQKVLIYPDIIKDKECFLAMSEPIKLKVTNIDAVNSPSHYTWLKRKCGIEAIDLVRHFDFCIGNALKYLLRAGHKSEEGMTNKEKTIQDLKKAAWYINDKIKQLENGQIYNM